MVLWHLNADRESSQSGNSRGFLKNAAENWWWEQTTENSATENCMGSGYFFQIRSFPMSHPLYNCFINQIAVVTTDVMPREDLRLKR